MNPWLIAAGAGLGLIKGKEDERKHQALMEAEATKTKYSPWTGMKGNISQGPSVMGNAMQGAVTGAMMGDFEDEEKKEDPASGALAKGKAGRSLLAV